MKPPHLLIALAAVLLTGCTIGYRHTVHGSTFPRDEGRELSISGQGDDAYLYATFDFRYVRLGMPFNVGRRRILFEDEEGSRDRLELLRERRLFRLDVPVLSLRDLEAKEFGGYPGLMRHRHSLELWLSGETDLRDEAEWWVDLGLAYYRYNGIGVRLYGGVGSVPFVATTPIPGSRFPRVWDSSAPMFGAGIEMTVTAGEYGLDLFELLLGIDREHRDRSRRYGWD